MIRRERNAWPGERRRPLKDEGEGGDGECGKGVAVDNEDIVAHPPVEGDLGYNVHAGVAELEGDHGHIRLHPLEEAPHGELRTGEEDHTTVLRSTGEEG